MYFSKLTGGFYSDEIHGQNIPEDAKSISDELYQSLIQGQAEGAQISSDEEGNPVLIERPGVPFETLRDAELDLFRGLREQYLNRLAGIMVAAQVDGDTATAQAALAMRRGLLDLPASDSVANAESLSELQTAIKVAYATLVASVPAKLRDEFRKVQE